MDLTAVVVDEWELMTAGISGVLAPLGVNTVATARDSRSGIKAARQHRADIVVLGTCADRAVGGALRSARHLSPRPRVFLLVSSAESADLAQLLADGADALLVRSAGLDELISAFERAVAGERVVAPALLPSLLGAVPTKPSPEAKTLLSRRERDVLAQIAQGRTNREIAAELFLGEETVKSHLSRLYTKLDASNRRDAVSRALSLGLLG
jgi:DNA-binding NarL/FixJ family response regulator